MKPGFVLLEVLIALMLGAIIATALFTSLFQINKSVSISEHVVEYDARAVLVHYQLERDLLGAFVPYEFVSQKETTTTETTTEIKPKTLQAPGLMQRTETTKKETAKKEEPVEKSFYADMQEGVLKELTFITSNPLPAYNTAKPRIARVTYRLVPEQQRQNMPPSYRIMREESTTLKPVQDKGENVAKGAELARGIKNLKIEFKCRPPQKKEAANKPQGDALRTDAQEKKKEEKPPLETFQVWGKEQVEKVKHLVPQEVAVTLTLWDGMRKKEHTFETVIALLVDEPVRAEEKAAQQDTKSEDKAATGRTEAEEGQSQQQTSTVSTSTMVPQIDLAQQALMLEQFARELHATPPSQSQISMLEGVPQ